jgi:geranyl-CoA carboxylase alpha subunit
VKTDFATILVANRGEIAVRVIRAARALGFQTVAVYSDADAGSPHVAEADRAVALGGVRPEDSYLAIPRILAAAKAAGADAVHPGYGFLSENPAFADACSREGLAFIGPGAEAIRVMGNKRQAKERAAAAGVPCLPGYEGEEQGDEALTAAAEALGYPLMVKAAAGGGGRGMRLVADAGELPGALASARSEAANAFGDGELILERAVAGARHVEVQVLADAHGNIVHLGERECSIQRRHQKVIEEAPSPAVTPELRARMGEAAVAAARAVDYVGAGTVEFLLDAEGAFSFLEMNTRLQVEHRVTELVTGTELVAWQIRIAAGEPLSFSQAELRGEGHAIEARLYAEEPAAGFLPQSGTVLMWRPARREGVLVDHCLAAGMEITPHYDPLVAKIVAWGRHREEARRRLDAALRETVLLGVPTNKAFLRAALSHPVFRAGEATTAFVEAHAVHERQLGDVPEEFMRALAAVLLAGEPGREEEARWSNPLPVRVVLGSPGGNVPVAVTRLRGQGSYRVEWEGVTGELEMLGEEDGRVRGRWEDVLHTAHVARGGGRVFIDCGAGCAAFEEAAPDLPGASKAAKDGNLLAPMAGRILGVRAKAGERVRRGQCLVVLEAMKMEQEIAAHADGLVERVAVKEGEQVMARQLLVCLTPQAEPT